MLMTIPEKITSIQGELETLAKEMENKHGAKRCAKFLREASKAYFP